MDVVNLKHKTKKSLEYVDHCFFYRKARNYLSISGKSIKTSSKSLFLSMVTSQYVFARTSAVLLSPNIKPTYIKIMFAHKIFAQQIVQNQFEIDKQWQFYRSKS